MAPKKGSVRKLTPSMLRMAVAVVICVIIRVGLDVAAMAAVRAEGGKGGFLMLQIRSIKWNIEIFYSKESEI
jgi:hypothetical protein